jgi:hypothetical protein
MSVVGYLGEVLLGDAAVVVLLEDENSEED